eukprot:TRINITY_DN2215_c0_g1_i1.p1 TRINITY_DN2215_c0_g1~~TRINITY_DN2215_c0_g1_i1.p1  ORF type:complete len:320 (+),score=57.36 TRINITY_DN2215_c0_g1_i1:235-1194(+)
MPSLAATVIGALYGCGACLLFIFVVLYVFIESRHHGVQVFWNNRFVTITFIGNCSLLLSLLYFSNVYFSLPGTDPILQTSLGVIENGGIFLFDMCQVALIYLRSQIVFRSSAGYVKVLKMMLVAFYVSDLFCAILFTIFAFYPATNSLGIVYEVFAILSDTLLGVIDVMSTISFGRYVQGVNAALKQTTGGHELVHQNQTKIIAKRSAVICANSFVTIVLYWCFWICIQVDGLSDHTRAVVVNSLYLVIIYQCILSAVLWMCLKIELDLIGSKNSRTAVNQSGEMLEISNPSLERLIPVKNNTNTSSWQPNCSIKEEEQ